MIRQKYISLRSILEWIMDPHKVHPSYLAMWKEMLKSLDIIGDGLVWNVGKGINVRIDLDMWPRSHQSHILPL